MSELSKYYKAFQDENPEKFNTDIINLKKNDDVLEKIVDACKSLETIDGIEFLGARIVPPEIYKPIKVSSKRKKDTFTEMDYEDSFVIDIEIKFRLSHNDEEEIVTKIISFPRLLDGYYYYINDVKYYPIFQLLDSETYHTSKGLTMRTALQPILINKDNGTAESVNYDLVIEGVFAYSKIFYIKTPIFYYFFAKMGVTNTIEFFNLPYEILEKEELTEDIEDIAFPIGKMLYVTVPVDYLDEEDNPNYKDNVTMLLTFLNAFKSSDRVSIDKIDSIEYWIKKIGSNFTKNVSNHYNKGCSVQKSFERLFDPSTKKIIRLNDDDKKDIYTLIRWILVNYNNLLKQDNNDLANKRLRLNECYIFPLLEKWTQGVLRILNSKKNDISTLKTLFSNIKKNFLVRKATMADNMRYMNNVNTIDLSNRLKVTTSGPQSISTKRGEIKGKSLHPSMLGRIDLIHTSNNDPGTTRMLTPFCEVTDSWHFTDKPNITIDENIHFTRNDIININDNDELDIDFYDDEDEYTDDEE